MGDISQADVVGMLGAFELELRNSGMDVPLGAGVEAAVRIIEASAVAV